MNLPLLDESVALERAARINETFEERGAEQRAEAPPETMAQRKDDLDSALALIAEAEGSGGLTGERLRELSTLLEGLRGEASSTDAGDGGNR